jgi:hypothetical protein
MSLAAGRFQLADAFKTLKQEWEATEEFWRDVVRKDFEKAHFDPLNERLAAVLTAIDRMDQSLARMRQECE